MQFPNIEDEDGDFSLNSTARSRLSSLFQTERASGDVNQALTFTAPKQPKKNENTQSSQGTLKLIQASTVYAYKLIDGSYTKQGKLGCAILGLHETNNYKLLLYKGKQVQVSTINILPTFKFHVQPNNFATFYDEKYENWSINFDSESELLKFAKQISLAKANSQDKNQLSLVIQDLAHGEGPSLDTGDSAEVKYTGWILSNYTFGQVFDSNMNSESAFRLRLGKKVIKGWSEGLIGAKRGTKRFLIVPPSLAYGTEGMGNAVPSNSTLIFEIIVTKVKISRDSSHSPSPLKAPENASEKKPEILPRHSITSEDNIRLRGASISEQLSQSPKKDKAQLISRMAKMGTATLPFQGAVPAQTSSDSENEEETQQEKQPALPVSRTGSRTSSPKPPSKSSSRKNSEQIIAIQPVQLQSVQETIPCHSTQQSSPVPYYPQTILPNQSPYTPSISAFPSFTNQYQMPPQTQYPMHNISGMVPSVTSSIADTHLPMLVTETRSQNTEVRLSLSKITDKIDAVTQKIDDLRLNQGRSGGLSHSPFMDSAMLVQSIEKIVQENSQLKEDTEAKNVKIQSLNEKICDLLQRNQGFFEESNNMLEQRSDSLQAVSAESNARLFSLEKDKAKLSTDLSNALSRLASVEPELMNFQNHESELRQGLQEKEKQIEELDSELSNLKKTLDSKSENFSQMNDLQIEIRNLGEENTRLSSVIKDWELKHNSLNERLTLKTKDLQDLQELLDKTDSDSKNSSAIEYKEKLETMGNNIKKIQTEKEELIAKCEDLQTKLSESQRFVSLTKEKISLLQTELQNSLLWKEKYEIFYQRSRQMKENYENQIQRIMTEMKQPDVSGAIRKVMNILYKLLQGKFEPATTYTGTQVLETTLQEIRGLTFQMLQGKEQRSESITKKIDSAKSHETANVEPETNNTDVAQTEDKLFDGGDHGIEVSATIQENGISEEVSKNIPHIPEAPSPSDKPVPSGKDITSLEPEESKFVPDITQKNSFSQSQKNNTDPVKSSEDIVESKEQLKSRAEFTEKSKAVSETRESPDHSEHLSLTNISGHSLSETGSSKVLDGLPA